MAQTKTRERVRNLDLADTKPKNEDELKALVLLTFQSNLAQNLAKKEYDKNRKALLAMMKNRKIKNKDFLVQLNPTTTVTLEAIVEASTSDKVDVHKLAKLIDADTFMQVVSATKGAVVDLVGAAAFEQCKETVTGEENVSVKLKKD